MILKNTTVQIFQSAFNRLTLYYPLIQNRTAIIAYSGGKDSTLLTYFYKYLYQSSQSPEPILFHLDHSIRNNVQQEKEIGIEMENLFNKISIKKKTFQRFLNL
jgi:tRNA(Ile)-lysidine synthase